jgi:hypothetical protein
MSEASVGSKKSSLDHSVHTPTSILATASCASRKSLIGCQLEPMNGYEFVRDPNKALAEGPDW